MATDDNKQVDLEKLGFGPDQDGTGDPQEIERHVMWDVLVLNTQTIGVRKRKLEVVLPVLVEGIYDDDGVWHVLRTIETGVASTILGPEPDGTTPS